MFLKRIVLVLAFMSGVGGCNDSQTVPTTGNKTVIIEESPLKEASSDLYAADPAVRKCLDDGFELGPIMKNGVPVAYICINPATDKKCNTWAYYRGECDL